LGTRNPGSRISLTITIGNDRQLEKISARPWRK
jgi:hypothetical protein